MKSINNKAHKESKKKDVDNIKSQLFFANSYNNQGKNIQKYYNIELRRDIETFRKVWYIASCMDTEDSTVYEVFFESELTDQKKTKIITSALELYSKKRKEIIKTAVINAPEDMEESQEVALCGAIFRIAVAVPAMLALNGKCVGE